jgi:hypothetical protein
MDESDLMFEPPAEPVVFDGPLEVPLALYVTDQDDQ